jgi:hypothetical protein
MQLSATKAGAGDLNVIGVAAEARPVTPGTFHSTDDRGTTSTDLRSPLTAYLRNFAGPSVILWSLPTHQSPMPRRARQIRRCSGSHQAYCALRHPDW